MDLNNLDLQAKADGGVRVELKHPGTLQPLLDEKDTQIAIWVYGRDSSRWAAVAKTLKAEYAEKKLDMDDIGEALIEVLTQCVFKWEGNIEFEGEALDCNPENVAKLFQNPGFVWMTEQVLQGAGDRSQLFLMEPNA